MHFPVPPGVVRFILYPAVVGVSSISPFATRTHETPDRKYYGWSGKVSLTKRFQAAPGTKRTMIAHSLRRRNSAVSAISGPELRFFPILGSSRERRATVSFSIHNWDDPAGQDIQASLNGEAPRQHPRGRVLAGIDRQQGTVASLIGDPSREPSLIDRCTKQKWGSIVEKAVRGDDPASLHVTFLEDPVFFPRKCVSGLAIPSFGSGEAQHELGTRSPRRRLLVGCILRLRGVPWLPFGWRPPAAIVPVARRINRAPPFRRSKVVVR